MEKKLEVETERIRDFSDSFSSLLKPTEIFPRTSRAKLKDYDKSKPGLFKVDFWFSEKMFMCSKTYRCYDSLSIRYNFSSNEPNNRKSEDIGDGPIATQSEVLEEKEKETSKNRGIPTKNHNVAIYEQTEKDFFIFIRNEYLKQMEFILFHYKFIFYRWGFCSNSYNSANFF